jgi:hypothetical protein
MIYSAGSVRVEGGSHIILGTGTLFLQANIQPGCMLTLHKVVGSFQIAKVVSETELHLSRTVPGISLASSVETTGYSISADFTPNLMMPYPNKGEVDSATVLQRTFDILDRAVPTT